MNRRVEVLRQSITKITKILAGRDILVTQRGSGAYVSLNKETGEPEFVNIPNLPDNASEELICAVQGFMDHEVAHLLYTDFKLVKKALEKGQSFGNIYNIIEDVYIEQEIKKLFKGSVSNLKSTISFMETNYFTPQYQSTKTNPAATAMDYFCALAVPMARAWGGQKPCIDYMQDKWDCVQEITDKVEHLIPRFKTMASSQDAYKLAEDLFAALDPKEISSEGMEWSDSGSKSEDGDSDEGDDEGKKSGPKKSKSKKSEKKDKGDEDDKGDEEDGDSSGGDSDDEGEEAEADDAKGAGGDDGDGDDSDGDGDSDDGEAGDDSEEDGQSAKQTHTKRTHLHAPDHEEGVKDDPLKALEQIKDFDDIASMVISKEAEGAIRASDWRVFTQEFDKYEPLEVDPKEIRSGAISRFEEQTASMIGPMQKDIERMMASRNRIVWQPGLRRGKLHNANLHKLASGDDRVFRRREEHKALNTAVSVVIDFSGSMHSRMNVALKTAFALSQTLERCKIPHDVTGFTTDGFQEIYEVHPEVRTEYLDADAKMRFNRHNALLLPIMKSFEERINTTVKARFVKMSSYEGSAILSHNVDGESILKIAEGLSARKEKRKIMLVLSDGMPEYVGARTVGGGQQHLKAAVKDLESRGIETIGIGIQTNAPSHFYPKSTCLYALEDLPGKVMGEIKKML